MICSRVNSRVLPVLVGDSENKGTANGPSTVIMGRLIIDLSKPLRPEMRALAIRGKGERLRFIKILH